MKKIAAKLLFIFSLFFSFELYAKPYFDGEKIMPILLDKPFIIGSAEWEREITEVAKAQKNPDENELKKAIAEDQLEANSVSEAVDECLNEKNYPKLYKLLERTNETSKAVVKNTKNYWGVKRPFIADEKKIKALITPHHSPSYPSGHATGSYVQAHILGLLFPQKRQQFQQRAAEIAWHRVLGGMHYPNDLVAGQQMALLTVGALLNDKDFQKDFKKAKQEIADSE